jgi:hypothetical protein
MEDAVMEQALRPYAAAGVALLGAGMVAVMSAVTPPALPKLQTSEIRLVDAEADALALLVSAIDPGAFTNGISSTATDSLGQLAVSIDSLIDLGGAPYITGADNLATDLLPLLDVTGLFSGLTTSLDGLLGDLGNLGNLSTLLSNLPTATDIANDVVSALTGPGGVLTTIESDITGLPSTLLGDLTGAGDPLSVVDSDLTSLLTGDTTIEGDLSTITSDLTTITGDLTSILGHLGI